MIIQPLVDDLSAEIVPDKIIVGRPGGLMLSVAGGGGGGENGARPAAYHSTLFDSEAWTTDRQVPFRGRQMELMRAVSAATPEQRAGHRYNLARFYLARGFYQEARGVLDVAVAEDRPTVEEPVGAVLRAVANIMLGRGAEALKDLSNPAVGNQNDAPLWRALAYARQGKWVEARESFKAAEAAISTLPIDLQRLATKELVRTAIEAKDYADAARGLNELETIGVPAELKPAVAVLAGRLAEGLGRISDALASYRAAAGSADRPSAAEGRLREVLLRHGLKEAKPAAVIDELEALTTVWRGDDSELEALALLGRLYTEDGRFRDAFYVTRNLTANYPHAALTRRMQDESSATFDALFLTPRGDTLAPIDALTLFYDFRELLPIGRRGDEMIRRLADRMVSVDLLTQAAELLQHQVDHRLQGAARAQVATRLAVIYLMNRKADRALATLRATRTADLNNDLRNQRLLLEARALSDVHRHDLALEVVANQSGPEVERLRADILWAAKRWRDAAEQIEKLKASAGAISRR